MRNHTATHLLHAALRNVLGHARQAGRQRRGSRIVCASISRTTPHTDPEELAEIQKLVNEEILKNIEVHTDVMDLDQALNTGAMALFGEKYGDRVRVVSIPGIQQGALRRHARPSHRRHRALRDHLRSAASRPAFAALKPSPAKRSWTSSRKRPLRRAQAQEKLAEEKRALERQIEQMKEKLAPLRSGRHRKRRSRNQGRRRFWPRKSPGMDREQLRTMVDSLRVKWKTAVVVLASLAKIPTSPSCPASRKI